MLTVYTTESCVYCPMVKKFLQFKNQPYQEVDVTNDSDARAKLHNMTGMMTVPVVTKGEQFVVGYNPSALAKLLA